MQIKKQLSLSSGITVAAASVILLVFLFGMYQVEKAVKASEATGDLITGSFERSTFKTDYLLNGGERAKKQWFAKHEQIGRVLKGAPALFRDPADVKIIQDLVRDHEATGRIFSSIVKNRERPDPEALSPDLAKETERRLVTQLEMRLYDKILMAGALRASADAALLSSLKHSGWIIGCLLSLAIAAAAINSWILYRTLIDRIARLQEGSMVIGGGGLDHRIDIRGDDEFAQLSDAFNTMSAALSASYQRLEGEIETRSRAQEELRRKEADLQEAQRIAHLGSWYWDAWTDATTGSDELFRIYGLDPAQQHMPAFQEQRGWLYPAESWERVNEAVQRTMLTGAGYELDVPALRNGARIWVTTRGEVVRGAEGRIVGLMGTVQDITERKHNEENLQQALAKAEEGSRTLEAIMENVPLGITLADAPDVNIRYVSRHGREMSGRPRGQLEGISIELHSARWDIYHPDGVTMAANEELPLTRATLKGELVQQEEWVLGHADGTRIPVLCTAAPVRDGAGNILGGVIGWQDISRRKQDEEEILRLNQILRDRMDELSALLEILPVGVWIGNHDCSEIVGNPAAYRIMGFPPDINASVTASRQEVPPVRVFIDGLEVPPEDAPMQQVARSGRPWHNFENELVFPDGTRKTAYASAVPLLDQGGQVRGVIAAYADFTEYKRLTEELLAYRHHLEELVTERTRELEDRTVQLEREIMGHRRTEEARKSLENQLILTQKMDALGRFAGGIAHDMNNILYPIIINTQMLLDEVTKDGPMHETLTQMLDAAYRQRNLIRQILSFSRRSEQDFASIKVRPVLEETIGLLKSFLPSTITIETRIDAHSDTIIGDSTQIQQIIMNLFRNAADAIGPQRGTIEVRLENRLIEPGAAHPELKAGQYLTLTVKDDGQGMTPEVMANIFEPFFTTKEVGKGSGMGLAVVHGILKNHGGAIAVESTPGKGSLFIVHLPATDEEPPALSPSCDDLPVQERRSVLLVDDEVSILSSLQNALKKLGYDVVATNDAAEALELFRARPGTFDLVITDLTMPQLTGVELAVKLVELQPDIPIILCTGYIDAIHVDKARSFGIREVLLKPSGMDELKGAIGRVLV